MKIRVVKQKNNTQLCVLDFDSEKTVKELKMAIEPLIKVNWMRIMLSQEKKKFSNYDKVSKYLSADLETIEFKDLGAQLPYKMLFFIEYVGPLITIPILYYLSGNKSKAAKYGAILGMVHFLKRELESEFVHIFSNASVPVSGSIKNFIHYWIAYGIFAVGEILFFKGPAGDWPKKYFLGFTIVWAICQFMNLRCHLILRNIRVGGDGKIDAGARGIPKGAGFQVVHCANYMWEILGWTIYSIMTKSWLSGAFTLFGAFTMAIWAQGKKKKLIECYKDDPEVVKELKRKAAIIPFLY